MTKRQREDLYNVDQHTILRLTSQPSTLILNGHEPAPLQLTPAPSDLIVNTGGRLTPLLPIDPQPRMLLQPMPSITITSGSGTRGFTMDEFLDFYKRNLPPYQPPSTPKDEEQ